MKGDAYGIDLIKLTAYEKYKTRAHHHAWFHILSLATIVVLDPCSVEAQSYIKEVKQSIVQSMRVNDNVCN